MKRDLVEIDYFNIFKKIPWWGKVLTGKKPGHAQIAAVVSYEHETRKSPIPRWYFNDVTIELWAGIV